MFMQYYHKLSIKKTLWTINTKQNMMMLLVTANVTCAGLGPVCPGRLVTSDCLALLSPACQRGSGSPAQCPQQPAQRHQHISRLSASPLSDGQHTASLCSLMVNTLHLSALYCTDASNFCPQQQRHQHISN